MKLSVELTDNGNKVEYTSLTQSDSFAQCYSTVVVTVPLKLTNPAVDGKECVIQSYTYNNGMYAYTLIPKVLFKLLQSTFPSIEQKSSLKSLLVSIGVKTTLQDSATAYYRIAQCKFRYLLTYLQRYGYTSNGGGLLFTALLDGSLAHVDLKSKFATSPTIDIAATIVSDTLSSDFPLNYAGVANLISYPQGTTTKVGLDKTSSVSNIRVLDTTGNDTDLCRRRFSNEYYSHYYRQRELQLSGLTQTPQLGELIKVNGISSFVVTARTITYDSTDQPKITVTVNSFR